MIGPNIYKSGKVNLNMPKKESGVSSIINSITCLASYSNLHFCIDLKI